MQTFWCFYIGVLLNKNICIVVLSKVKHVVNLFRYSCVCLQHCLYAVLLQKWLYFWYVCTASIGFPVCFLYFLFGSLIDALVFWERLLSFCATLVAALSKMNLFAASLACRLKHSCHSLLLLSFLKAAFVRLLLNK